MTTGKGKVDLKDSAIRPVEIFMCSVVRRMGYGGWTGAAAVKRGAAAVQGGSNRKVRKLQQRWQQQQQQQPQPWSC